MGDLNFNYANVNCPNTKSLKTLEQMFDIRQLKELPTRSTKNSCSVIDLCFSNMNNISHYGVINYHISDHCPIFVIKKKLKLEKKTLTFRGRNYKVYSVDRLALELDKFDWKKIERMSDPNTMWESMLQIFMKVADIICPFTDYRITRTKPVYISNEILEYTKERDLYFKLAKRHKDMSYWKKGLDFAKLTMKLCKEAKQSYIKKLLKDNQKDSCKFWNAVKLVLPDSKASQINLIWDESTKKMVTGLDSANLINNFFSDIGMNLASEIGSTDMEFQPPMSPVTLNWGWSITIPEFQKLLDKCSYGKSSGIVELSSRILIDCMKQKVALLTNLYNKCFETGVFPSHWKTGIMVPIL